MLVIRAQKSLKSAQEVNLSRLTGLDSKNHFTKATNTVSYKLRCLTSFKSYPEAKHILPKCNISELEDGGTIFLRFREQSDSPSISVSVQEFKKTLFIEWIRGK